MDSSDSDDDCYGNAAAKVQQILNIKRNQDLINSFNDSFECPISTFSTTDIIDLVDLNDIETIDLLNDGNCSKICSKKPRKRPKRKSKENDTINLSSDTEPIVLDTIELDDVINDQNGGKRPKKQSKRGKNKNSSNSPPKTRRKTKNTTIETDDTIIEANARRITRSSTRNTQNEVTEVVQSTRGRRGRNTTSRSRNRRSRNSNIPTFSIGNTDYYDDLSHSQKLFTEQPKDPLKMDDDLENEELSVKVYWKSSEVIKFQIRKYQKLKQIFDHFSDKEKVGNEKLYFTYNDVVINVDDCPDSIGYNISRFIEGGIVNERVLMTNMPKAINGISIKFQCQNEKKPFEVSVSRDEGLSTAMLKCAEHFEKPIDKLQFYFDGDLISGKSTPKDLDLESGDCIDIKVIR